MYCSLQAQHCSEYQIKQIYSAPSRGVLQLTVGARFIDPYEDEKLNGVPCPKRNHVPKKMVRGLKPVMSWLQVFSTMTARPPRQYQLKLIILHTSCL